jgi:hypothetical protein
MRIAAAALLYFGIVFGVGLLLGPIRVLWLEPQVGPAIAVACETPFLLAAMLLAARRVPSALHLRRSFSALATMGIGALLLQQAADLVVGVGLRGLSPTEQLAQFATPAGRIYAAALIAFAAMPLLVNWRRSATGAGRSRNEHRGAGEPS